jgi:hypothetical protein
MTVTHTETSSNGASGASGASGKITRKDIETKLRQIRGDVDTAEEAAKGVGTIVAGAAVVVLVVAVFLFGKRRGKRSSTVVEVRRF